MFSRLSRAGAPLQETFTIQFLGRGVYLVSLVRGYAPHARAHGLCKPIPAPKSGALRAPSQFARVRGRARGSSMGKLAPCCVTIPIAGSA
jgi:hypothetical protein